MIARTGQDRTPKNNAGTSERQVEVTKVSVPLFLHRALLSDPMKDRMDLKHILQKGTDLEEVTGWERSDVSGRCLSHVLYGNLGFYALSGHCTGTLCSLYSSVGPVHTQQAHSSGFYPQHHIKQV